MPKRFTATEKWDDPWFCSLPCAAKLLWLYMLDRCDHAGIWRANWPLAKFHLGALPEMDIYTGRVVRLSEEKLFIPKFLSFQYGDDLEKSHVRVAKSALEILAREGISRDKLKGYLRVSKELDKSWLTTTATATDSASASANGKESEENHCGKLSPIVNKCEFYSKAEGKCYEPVAPRSKFCVHHIRKFQDRKGSVSGIKVHVKEIPR